MLFFKNTVCQEKCFHQVLVTYIIAITRYEDRFIFSLTYSEVLPVFEDFEFKRNSFLFLLVYAIIPIVI
jgi:hypothetical protein